MEGGRNIFKFRGKKKKITSDCKDLVTLATVAVMTFTINCQ